MSAAVASLPAKHASKHPDPSSGDQSFEKFFDEVIASPELNLLDDVFAEEIDQKPDIHQLSPPHPVHPPPYHHHHHHHPAHHPSMSHHHPILHRLQPVPPPPLSILKPHVLQQPVITPPSTGSGGISPTLTWSGDPSPVDHDSNSPTLNDPHDLDGEEWKPQPTLFPANSTNAIHSRRSSTASRGRERIVADVPASASASASLETRSRSSQRSLSTSTSADGGDELTMSQLSIQNGTATLALISSTSNPHHQTTTPRGVPTSPTSARKKTRTNSSSRSSISSIDALISEAMAGPSSPAVVASTNRLVPTGHRRNITSSSLVPLDAPTQVRNYLTPSSTSKKEIPSAFLARRNKLKAKEAASASTPTPTSPSAPLPSSKPTRKRTREEAGFRDDDSEHVDELQEDEHQQSQSQVLSAEPAQQQEVASESSSLLSAIEAKRRQNTLAARRSRQRKLDYVRNLEELVAALTKERDSWKTRAENAEKVLGYIPGEDDMDEDEDD